MTGSKHSPGSNWGEEKSFVRVSWQGLVAAEAFSPKRGELGVRRE